MNKLISLFLLSYSSISTNEAARILAVFPTTSISHQVVFRPLVHELVKRGHEVVLITPDPAFSKGQAPTNLTEIDVHDISYGVMEKSVPEDIVLLGAKSDMKTSNLAITYFLTEMLRLQLTSEQVQNVLQDKSQQFDLLLIEAFLRPALIFSHFYKVPVIQVSSFGPVIENLDTVGAPTHPILYPLCFSKKQNNINFWDRLEEFYNFFEYRRLVSVYEDIENSMLRDVFGPNVPPVSNLVNNVDMVFLNLHPIWDSNRPVPPNVIYMGGLHQTPGKELPQELKTYLDSSKNGVIYMSFGTNVKPVMFEPGTDQLFLNVLSSLPYDVLWKWNADLPHLPKNVKVSKWYPQADLLKHPKVKLFITQGGLQSTDESITAGVPLVCIPMLGDQWFNAERYEQHRIGVKIDVLHLTEEKFKSAILTVLNDDSYRQNIIKLRELMRDQPQSPLERAVWWTEHVLRHGGAVHLRAPAANLAWTRYYELPLLATVLAALATALVLALLVVRLVVKVVCTLLFRKRKVKNN